MLLGLWELVGVMGIAVWPQILGGAVIIDRNYNQRNPMAKAEPRTYSTDIYIYKDIFWDVMTLFAPVLHVTQLRTIDPVLSLSLQDKPLKLCVN